MKNLLKFFLAGVFALLLTACSSSKPEDVAVEFTEKFYANEDNVKELAQNLYYKDEKSKNNGLKKLENEDFLRALTLVKNIKNEYGLQKIEATETEVFGNDATVKIKMTFEKPNPDGKTEYTTPVKLRLQDDEWRVDARELFDTSVLNFIMGSSVRMPLKFGF